MGEQRYWNEAMETIDPARLWKLEDERLRWQLRWVWERSPFYRQKFADAGIDPLTIGIRCIASRSRSRTKFGARKTSIPRSVVTPAYRCTKSHGSMRPRERPASRRSSG